jgi:hypothetical protein
MCKPEDLITRFGGCSALAGKLGARPNAVATWRWRGAIPYRWHEPLRRLAKAEGIPLEEDELLSITSRGKSMDISDASTSSPPARDNADV